MIQELKSYLSGIADAFRAALGTTDTINAGDFADKVREVFEFGKSQGGDDITENPMYYMYVKGFLWANAAFPEGFELVLNIRSAPSDMNALLTTTTGIKTVTLICEEEGTVSFAQLIRASTAEILDISNFKPIPTSIAYLVYNNTSVVSIIGALDLSSCTVTTSAFSGAKLLKDIEFASGTILISISFANCPLLTAKSLDSIIGGLSPDVTGQTLTLPAYETVKATYDTVYGEGAWDAIVAEKSNWTIEYN